jgi:hypothetical protein
MRKIMGYRVLVRLCVFQWEMAEISKSVAAGAIIVTGLSMGGESGGGRRVERGWAAGRDPTPEVPKGSRGKTIQKEGRRDAASEELEMQSPVKPGERSGKAKGEMKTPPLEKRRTQAEKRYPRKGASISSRGRAAAGFATALT